MNHVLLSVGFELRYLHVSQKGEKALELHPCLVFALHTTFFFSILIFDEVLDVCSRDLHSCI